MSDDNTLPALVVFDIAGPIVVRIAVAAES